MLHRSLPSVSFVLLTSLVASTQTLHAAEQATMPPSATLGSATAFRVPLLEGMRLELSLGQRRVTLFRNTQALKSYPVAVGKAGWETPTGQFKVRTKVRNPSWRSPFNGSVIAGGHPRNPLGRRWIGFWTNGKDWIGFHGTPNRFFSGECSLPWVCAYVQRRYS